MARRTPRTNSQRPTAYDAYKARLKRVRAAVRENGADGLIISDPSDIAYLTPFGGEASIALVLPRTLVIVSDRRFEEELESVKGLARVVMREGAIEEAVAGVLGDQSDMKFAFQAGKMTVAAHKALAKRVGAKRLVPTTGLTLKVRAIKDELEIASIKKAVSIQQRALTQLLHDGVVGKSESQLAADLEHSLRGLGAEGAAFDIIMAAGPNSAKPHARPGAPKVKKNSVLLIDWGATVHGYRSDMTRTFGLGKWPKEISKVYDIVLEAYQAGVAAVEPGARCADVDEAARSVIRDAGYGKQFGHSLGHGIGLDVHEMPGLSSRSDMTLEAGMIVTIEPGIYLPGLGGVRLENDILVTPRGARNLCSLPMDKDWATL